MAHRIVFGSPDIVEGVQAVVYGRSGKSRMVVEQRHLAHLPLVLVTPTHRYWYKVREIISCKEVRATLEDAQERWEN